MQKWNVKVLDLILLLLTCCCRVEGLLSVFQTVIPTVGDGPVEKQILIISFSKFHSNGFPGSRERSWCELVDLLTFFQIPVRHKFMGGQTTLALLFVKLLALFCGGFLKSNYVCLCETSVVLLALLCIFQLLKYKKPQRAPV